MLRVEGFGYLANFSPPSLHCESDERRLSILSRPNLVSSISHQTIMHYLCVVLQLSNKFS